FVQRVLHLGRVDVLAAGDVHVLLAVHDPHVALLVPDRDVAGPEPAVLGERRRGGRVVAPVAAHHVRAPHDDLPRRSGRYAAAGVVDDVHVAEEARRAGGTYLA